MNIDIAANFPPILDGFFDEWARYYVLYGGRGSGKSWSVAQHLIIEALSRPHPDHPHRILCAREIQRSLKQSVRRLLVTTMMRMGCRDLFIVKEASIFCPMSGSEFLFSGLWGQDDNVRSLEGITICWIEEAQAVSTTSMQALVPTLRYPGSYFVLTMNPRFVDDYAYSNFIAPEELQRDDVKRLRVNHQDNPWFDQTELVAEMEFMKRTNPGLYRHVWEGDLNMDDEALVFVGNIRMEAFEAPEHTEFMLGQDYGFSIDPMAMVRCFLSKDERTLYVDYEAGGMTRLDLFDHPEEMDTIPQARRWGIKADSARPEYISWLRREGYAIEGTEKYKGSVEDGISWLQSVDIVVHPRCQLTWAELRTHKFKRHAQTDQVTKIPEDANNHFIDALRYATGEKWRRRKVRIGGT